MTNQKFMKTTYYNEKYVLFETAILAKEKGFDWNCREYYDVNKNLDVLSYFAGNGDGYDNNFTCIKNDYYDYDIVTMCPTQSLLQKWLRDMYNIHIDIPYMDDVLKYGYKITTIIDNTEIEDVYKFETYEQALEQALFESLKLIKI